MEGYKNTTLEIIKKVGCDYEVFTSENTSQEVEALILKHWKRAK